MSSLLDRALELAVRRARDNSKVELKARGVVATPAEVARHAVQRVHALLRSEFGIREGLASERVVVIDPAVGTGVWLAAVLEHTRALGQGPAMFAFDVDAASLSSLDALLGEEAARQGTALFSECANTLERAEVLRDDARVRVVLGNPPWAARSLSRGGLSDRWLLDFQREADGSPLDERRRGVLSDDYVRFFRWALEQATTSASGSIVCFATNHSFLDGPIHRGMRAALLRAFDRLDLLDLGGNTLVASGGSDENLFGVRVGAALTWGVRRAGEGERTALVRYARLAGRRSDKLAALEREVSYRVHAPVPPYLSLRATNVAQRSDFFSLAEALPFHREGVQTNRDAFVIAASQAELVARLESFVAGGETLAPLRHFDPESARRKLAAAFERGALPIERLAYRPLDARYLLALAPLCHRPRPELSAAVRRSELCLLTVRKDRGNGCYNLFAPATVLSDACFLSVRSSCRTRVFPARDAAGGENLAAPFRDELARRIERDVSGRELLLYALGVLASARFRAQHDEALKLDYPRLPWPRDAQAFTRRVAVGARLLHALEGELDEAVPGTLRAERGDAVRPEALAFDPSRGELRSGGRVLIGELSPAHFFASVGDHGLVASALRAQVRPTLADVAGALCRAARWVSALEAADREQERVDSDSGSA